MQVNVHIQLMPGEKIKQKPQQVVEQVRESISFLGDNDRVLLTIAQPSLHAQSPQEEPPTTATGHDEDE